MPAGRIGGVCRPTALALLFLPFFGVALDAQSVGNLTGTVVTSAGDPVADTALTVASVDAEIAPITVQTDADGDFRLTGLRPGRYDLTIDAPPPPFTLDPDVQVGVIANVTVRRNLTLLTEADRAPAWQADELLAASPGLTATRVNVTDVTGRDTFSQFLERVPGITVSRPGGVGQQASVRVRGVETRNDFALTNGLPLDDLFFLVADRGPLAPRRLDVMRGAVPTRYGGTLTGAVQQLTDFRAAADGPRLTIDAEGGSLGWGRVAATTAGRRGRYDWHLGAQRFRTDNEQPNGAFSRNMVEGTFGAIAETASARLFFRGETSTVGVPGQTLLVAADRDAREERTAFLLGATLRLRRGRTTEHELRIVASQGERLSLNPLDSGSFDLLSTTDDIIRIELPDFSNQTGFQNDLRLARLNYEYSLEIDRFHLFSFGVEFEGRQARLGAALPSIGRFHLSLYGEDRIQILPNMSVTAGARAERNGPYGFQIMPRGSALWEIGRGFTVHGGGGFGVATPTLEDRFGETFTHRGNAFLLLGRSRTIDGGIRRALWSDRVRLDLTAYLHSYSDLPVRDDVEFPDLESLAEFSRLTLAERSQLRMDVLAGLREPLSVTPSFDQVRTTWVNLPSSRAYGFEFAVDSTLTQRIDLGAVYTFTNTLVKDGTRQIRTGQALPEVPRHHGALTGDVRLGRLAIGASLRYVGERAAGVNFVGHALGRSTVDGYTRWDARGAFRLGDHLDISFVGENLTDAAYEEVLGYPGLGRLVRAGLHVNF